MTDRWTGPQTRRHPPARAREHQTCGLVERLSLRADDLADQLCDAVVDGVPPVWKAVMDAECRPLTHLTLPEALACVRHGGSVDPGLLELVQASARRQRARRLPIAVFLGSMAAASRRFSSIAIAEAGLADVRALPQVLARAAVISHEFAQAFGRGYHEDAGYSGGVREERAGVTGRPTPGQLRILRLVAQGRTSREIAGVIGCTDRNVDYHVQRMMALWRVESRAALVGVAHRGGMLDEDPEAWDAAVEHPGTGRRRSRGRLAEPA